MFDVLGFLMKLLSMLVFFIAKSSMHYTTDLFVQVLIIHNESITIQDYIYLKL